MQALGASLNLQVCDSLQCRRLTDGCSLDDTCTRAGRLVFFPALLTAVLVALPHASEVAIKLVDVAAEAGITLLNICGGASKDYIIEVNGNGAAFFDYDNDSDMDVLIVNGSTLASMKEGGDRMVALYRNDGKGRFDDVTAASRLDARGWGMGTCIADYDGDGFQDVYVTAFGANVLARNNDGFQDVYVTASGPNVRSEAERDPRDPEGRRTIGWLMRCAEEIQRFGAWCFC